MVAGQAPLAVLAASAPGPHGARAVAAPRRIGCCCTLISRRSCGRGASPYWPPPSRRSCGRGSRADLAALVRRLAEEGAAGQLQWRRGWKGERE